ncbi:MAG: UDP-N-acetylmuramate--L-alanine ligase [Flavobacteriales bacterium]
MLVQKASTFDALITDSTVKVHLIAIGGSAMHNLAIALHLKGFEVTGSDDEIFEPSKGRLKKYGLLPATEGWDAAFIHENLDAVIVGMHARADNPELIKAQELGLKIYSYPEYLYEQTKEKTRVVIGGSHGKTSITAMVLHALAHNQMETDYMVGAQLAGFECMVKLSAEAPRAILEGDEYLSSPIDRRPKFHLYHPNIALISGIAWDHINVFPTFENYVDQFRIFIDKIEAGGTLVYCEADEEVKKLCAHYRPDIQHLPYTEHPHFIENGTTFLITDQGHLPLLIFGRHNLQNLNGARLVCESLGMSSAQFYEAIQSFGGAARRLELVKKSESTAVYKDFAHSPSKLKATTAALKEQYPNRHLVACMELHTFSSLNANFLGEYKDSMSTADEAFVYYNPHTIEHKKLAPISEAQVLEAFGGTNVRVFTQSAQLIEELTSRNWENQNLLLMTSGNFDGVDFAELANRVC